MSVALTVEQLSALSALGLTTEQIVRAAEIICPRTSDDILAARREKDRKRKALKRSQPKPEARTIPDVSADNGADTSPRSPTPSKNNITPLFQNQDSGKGKEEIQYAREDRFPEFWATYPKREGNNPRKPAAERFTRAVARGADPGEIISGAHRYAQHLKATGKDGSQFVQQAVTWLNQEGWKNEYQQRQNGFDRSDLMGAAERVRARLGAGDRDHAQGGGSQAGFLDRLDADLPMPGDYIEH